MFPRTGYYVTEKRLIEEAPEHPTIVSFLDFLRLAKSRKVSGQIYVYGLDEVARVWGNVLDFARFMRETIRPLASSIFMQGSIVVFVVEGQVSGNGKPVLRYQGVVLHLSEIFGADRIEQGEGTIYSPPNIP